MPDFYDTHAHLDYDDYKPDFAEVLDRAQSAGITKIISYCATDLESSRRAPGAGGKKQNGLCRRWLASKQCP